MDYKKMWEEFYAKVSRSKKTTFTKGDIMQMMTQYELAILRNNVKEKEEVKYNK